MKNFDYLKDIEELADLYEFCRNAEDTQRTNPRTSAWNARNALEWIVIAVYRLKSIKVTEQDRLFELMTGEPFTEFIGDDEKFMMAAHYVRKVGNHAAHPTTPVKSSESFYTLLNLYNCVGGILLRLGVLKTLAPFDRTLIPSTPAITVAPPQVVPVPSEAFVASVPAAAVAAPLDVDGMVDFSEAETRRQFIDLMLEEAGWEVLTKKGAIVAGKACIEVELEGMPNKAGKGYADYVLFGADGKPLAVIEAKSTTKDPATGKHQAELYADLLEKRYGLRPVIYYTNGFSTHIIDGLGYPSRIVNGFHTQGDLMVLIQRRGRTGITDLSVNDEITDREYQKRAIHAICDHFNAMHRRGLLVMATGTGKTRTAISLCDVLMRNGWVKNILFLADRTSLVRQAHRNFTKLLSHATTCILNELTGTSEGEKNARIMFSTHQTMINYIDSEEKEFSVGRFDLIIVDEVHRSIFGKYKSILSYYDALMVGLTATPREQDDKSTYDLFHLDTGQPNFEYTQAEAVDDEYLVPERVLSRTTTILKGGIKYDSLTVAEQSEFDAVWKYEKARADIPDEVDYSRDIGREEIFKYIFNKDTIDKVIIDLMDNGLKINGGESIGKTIIFAYNHNHAQLIVERFKALYPALGDEYCQLIDNTVNYAQNLINLFEERGKLPQIAVSVDMLDTGIDVPDILNLVFFKPVRSKIKLIQMIGRGTRLSERIFDDGTDKKFFYIFDWCGNLDNFGPNGKGDEPIKSISLTERLFGLRVDLAIALQAHQWQEDPFARGLHDETKQILRHQVEQLSDSHISVREHWMTVTRYKQEDAWTYLSNVDGVELKDTIAPLLVKGTTNLGAIKFDILMLQIQLSTIDDSVNGERAQVTVENIAKALQERASIPQVNAQMKLINQVAHHNYWQGAALDKLENVRLKLRDLVQFITGMASQQFVINIKDAVEVKQSPGSLSLPTTYKQRVVDYLAQNRDLPVINKIFNMEQLSPQDIRELERICWKELGSKEEYEQFIAKSQMICGDSVGAFIRAQVGVDRHIAMERFSQFLDGADLNPMQEEYVKTIVSYVCQNGDITPATLVNTEPFSDFDWLAVFNQDFVAVRDYVNKLHDLIA